MKKIKNIALIGMVAVGVLCSSCSEDFLKPDPLSFYEPEQTFTTEAGLRSVVATLDRHLRNYWTYYQAANLVTPFYTLFMHTDLAVAGKTDQSTIWADPSERLTPSDGMGGGGSEVNQFSYFWGETYTGIKSANTITSYIGKIKDMDEASRNKYIGWAYFHRAYRYLSLVFMFKDVPLVTKIIEGPKFDYKTTSREAILAKMVEDMEFAVQWVPEQKDMKEIGLVNKGACRMLLSKLYLATGQWEKAIQQLNEVIDNSGYSLMTNTFGTFVTPFNTETWPIQRNVIWDLHRPELLIFLGGLLIVGRLLDSFTPLNLREYLVFAYVVFFGWVTLELFRQIYTAPLVDRESVLAALCGLLLIGYCGFFVFVAVEFHQPGSFSGLTPGGQGFRDLFYFSYVTILTIGYGDITPHTWVAKNATILVALIAYMYSLVIVAMIVNQFAENRTLKRQGKARLSGSAQARLRESPPSGEGD